MVPQKIALIWVDSLFYDHDSLESRWIEQEEDTLEGCLIVSYKVNHYFSYTAKVDLREC